MMAERRLQYIHVLCSTTTHICWQSLMSSHGISAHKKIRNMESYDIIPMLINPFSFLLLFQKVVRWAISQERAGQGQIWMCCLKWYRQRGDGGITPEEAGVLLPLKTLFIANFHGLPLLIIRDRSFFGLIKTCLFISNPKYQFVSQGMNCFQVKLM